MRVISYLRDLWNIAIFSGARNSCLEIRVFAFSALFDANVFQFAGLEDLTALQAFHEFGVFVAAYNLHARVLTRSIRGVGRLGKRLCAHKSGSVALFETVKGSIRGNFPVF